MEDGISALYVVVYMGAAALFRILQPWRGCVRFFCSLTEMVTEKDIGYMRMAMSLAEKGRGHVNPNPLVGAVIVRDGRVTGEGWHRRYGDLHAEREALAACTEDTHGSTMYVTLEPCCHHGKQPPCTDAIINAGIRRVVAGMTDPNPLVAGKGLALLAAHGIEVECGLLEEELRYQNRVFLRYITARRPWVTMKWAMTLDGRIAARTGDSKWVSSEESRTFAHRLRGWNMAIMAGIGTVRADDPMLNCRLDGMRSPVRVIVDSKASIALSSAIVRTAGQYRTIVAYARDENRVPGNAGDIAETGTVCGPDNARADVEGRVERLAAAGVETVECAGKDGRVDIGDLLSQLGRMGIDSVLVEGGSELDWSIVEAGLADEVYCFIAPKIIGGSLAKGPVGGSGFDRMAEALGLEIESVTRTGPDILVHAFPCNTLSGSGKL